MLFSTTLWYCARFYTNDCQLLSRPVPLSLPPNTQYPVIGCPAAAELRALGRVYCHPARGSSSNDIRHQTISSFRAALLPPTTQATVAGCPAVCRNMQPLGESMATPHGATAQVSVYCSPSHHPPAMGQISLFSILDVKYLEIYKIFRRKILCHFFIIFFQQNKQIRSHPKKNLAWENRILSKKISFWTVDFLGKKSPKNGEISN